jgi:hypothetical protein
LAAAPPYIPLEIENQRRLLQAKPLMNETAYLRATNQNTAIAAGDIHRFTGRFDHA